MARAADVSIPEDEPCEPCEPSTSSAANSLPDAAPTTHAAGGFILHRVTKLDTLAGLAIKYNITVSDIKRANGILSDNAMFARELIKIPTGQLPIGEDAQVLFARLMSGYGRDASLNAKERKAPGTVSISQLPGSPSASRSSAFGSEAVDDEPGTPYSRRSDRSSSEPGDVELTWLGPDGSNSGYGSDRVRRRARHEGSQLRSTSGPGPGSQLATAAEAAVGWLSSAAAQAAQAAHAAVAPAANGHASLSGHGPAGPRRNIHSDSDRLGGGSSGSGSTWQHLSHAISAGSSSLVDKIRRAASQPALASPAAPLGFGDAADVLLLKRARPPGMTQHNSGSSSSIDLLARGSGLPPPPRKDTKGD